MRVRVRVSCGTLVWRVRVRVRRKVSVTRMSLAAVEGLEAVVGCEQGRWPEFIQVQKNGPYGGKNE